MRKHLLLLFLISSVQLWGQSPAQYSRVKILLEQTPIEKVAQLGLEVDHGQYAPNRFLINDFSSFEIQQLQQAGIPY